MIAPVTCRYLPLKEISLAVSGRAELGGELPFPIRVGVAPEARNAAIPTR